MRKPNHKTSEDGSILVLMSMTLPIVLLIAAGSYMIFTYTIATEQIEAASKMIVLAAAEEYLATECDSGDEKTPEGRDNCHTQNKMPAAILKAQEIADINTNSFGSITIRAKEEATDSNNEVLLSGGKYYYKKPSSNTDTEAIVASCGGDTKFPCYLDRKSGDISNAFTLSGTIYGNKILNALNNLFGFKFAESRKSFSVQSTAIPMRMCALIDMSRSATFDTHPLSKNKRYSYQLNADGEFDRDLDEEGDPTKYDLQTIWNSMDPERGADTNFERFYKDDYARVVPLGDHINSLGSAVPFGGYNDYIESYKAYHTEPSAEIGDDKRSYYIDLYRNDTYQGPEPWLSILKGVRESLIQFKKRSVAGDRACLIFYNEELNWKNVVNLNSDFDYMIKILDVLQFRLPQNLTNAAQWDIDDDSSPVADGIPTTLLDDDVWDPTTPSEDCDASVVGCMPLWARLGIFPASDTFTNTPMAFEEALTQFANDDLDIPSNDFVTHFSDGLTNCFQDDAGQPSCESINHFYYLKSMKNLEDIVKNGMYKKGIALHQFLVGDAVAPHTILADEGLASGGDAASGTCLSDEKARKIVPPVDLVAGNTIAAKDSEQSSNEAQQKFKGYFINGEEPFYQANEDWYNLVRMTGGIWIPIRPMNPICPDKPYDCDISTNLKDKCSDSWPKYTVADCAGAAIGDDKRLLYDNECRTAEEQVKDGLKEVMESSSGFTIIQTEN